MKHNASLESGLIVLMISAGSALSAQVGINTASPHASADLDLGSADRSLYLNRVANPATDIANPQPGMVVYDATAHCMKAYQGSPAAWTCLNVAAAAGSITGLTCGSAAFNSNPTQGQAYTGTLTVPYTGGNGGSYAAQSFTANGLTFTLPAGNFNTGAGNLVYSITGTPTAAGNTAISITVAGQSCSGSTAINMTTNPPAASITGIDCSAAVSPTPVAGATNYSGTFTISYSGGNGGSYPAQTLTSTPAGFTATRSAGTLNSGTGSVTYTVTASTVPAAGNYTFPVTLGGQSCSGGKSITVASAAGTVPSGFTLAQNQSYWIASVYDTDYLPYTAPTGPASTSTVDANGTADLTVDFQGTITTTGIQIRIPVVTATGATSNLLAWSSTFTVPVAYEQNGNTRTLQLSWAQQQVTTATKYITATIKAVEADFNAKKLDINAGLGSDYLGLLLGQFQYPYNNAGALSTYQVRDLPGIPDKMFGQADTTGSTTSHNFLYFPVTAEDGNIWLSNNLGADYANLNKAPFNLMQQATSTTDYKAYGSLFQFGRKPDGHELVNWTGASANTLTPNTSTKADIPGNNAFIFAVSGTPANTDWRNTPNSTLWYYGSINDPCPSGFRIPSDAEMTAYMAAAGVTNGATAFASKLKIPSSGIRSGIGSSAGNNVSGAAGYSEPGRISIYTSNVGGNPGVFYVPPGGTASVVANSGTRSYGYSERCIKN